MQLSEVFDIIIINVVEKLTEFLTALYNYLTSKN